MRLIIVVVVLRRYCLVKSHSLIAFGRSDASSPARGLCDVLGPIAIIGSCFALLHSDTHVMALSAAVRTVSVTIVDSNSVQFLSLGPTQSERLCQSMHVVEEIFSSLPLQLVDNNATKPSIASKIDNQSLH